MSEQRDDAADGFRSISPGRSMGPPLPAVISFEPGHDARIQVENGSQNTSVAIRFEFSDLMDFNSVTQSMSFNLSSSGYGDTPAIDPNSVQCLTMTNVADGYRDDHDHQYQEPEWRWYWGKSLSTCEQWRS